MGLFDKVEKGLEKAVNSAFAKAFRSEVQPAEIASAIRRRMDDRATVLAPGRTMVPNVYSIELSPSDFTRIDEFSDSISDMQNWFKWYPRRDCSASKIVVPGTSR